MDDGIKYIHFRIPTSSGSRRTDNGKTAASKAMAVVNDIKHTCRMCIWKSNNEEKSENKVEVIDLFEWYLLVLFPSAAFLFIFSVALLSDFKISFYRQMNINYYPFLSFILVDLQLASKSKDGARAGSGKWMEWRVCVCVIICDCIWCMYLVLMLTFLLWFRSVLFFFCFQFFFLFLFTQTSNI